MATEIKMPKLTQTMDEGKLLEWTKNQGDPVSKGDIVATVETDKATVELEAPAEGILARLVASPGDMVAVGSPIAYIAAPGEVLPPVEQSAAPSAPPVAAQPMAEAGPVPASQASISLPFTQEEPAPSSPRARRLAQELGIDLAAVQGTGPGGRIVEDDVRRAAEARGAAPTVAAAAAPSAPQAAPAAPSPVAAPVPQAAAPAPSGEVELVPLSGMRRTIAERMASSAHTAAPVTLHMDVDMTEVAALRRQMIAAVEVESAAGRRDIPRPSFTDIIVKAVAMALAEFPHVNARWTEPGIEIVKDINVGVAVALGETSSEGLVVPVIRNTDRLSLAEISRRTASIAERARQRRLSTEEFSGGTFTITNLGMFGVDTFTPIINPPEAAILGVGRIAPRPVVLDEEVAVRSMMGLSLTIDHRVIDGAAGAVFLRRLRDILQNPLPLLM